MKWLKISFLILLALISLWLLSKTKLTEDASSSEMRPRGALEIQAETVERSPRYTPEAQVDHEEFTKQYSELLADLVSKEKSGVRSSVTYSENGYTYYRILIENPFDHPYSINAMKKIDQLLTLDRRREFNERIESIHRIFNYTKKFKCIELKVPQETNSLENRYTLQPCFTVADTDSPRNYVNDRGIQSFVGGQDLVAEDFTTQNHLDRYGHLLEGFLDSAKKGED
jgi:hypothetical protein